MKSLRSALAGALGVLLGLQALRTFLTGVVWMIGESLSPNVMGLFCLGVVSLGLLAGAIKAQLGRQRAERVTALALSVLYVGALSVPDIALRVGLSGSATMVWVWWFSAFLAGRRPLPAALVGGLSLDLAVHASLFGLDLPFAGHLLSVVLIGAFFVAVASEPAPDGTTPGWGILALAPWLFVEIELLTSIGRLRMITGFGLTGALVVAAAGLVVSLLVMRLPMPGLVRSILGLVGAVVLVQPSGFLWVLAAQAGLGAAMAGSVRPGTSRLWSPAAVILLVIIFFIFYIQSTWPFLPAVCSLLLGLIALLVRSDANLPAPLRILVIPAGLALVAMFAGLLFPSVTPVIATERVGVVRFMTYNIHQAMDYQSLPSPERIARVIEAQSPDVVSLQEVNRGWTIAGGSDFVTWIEQRLPEYHLIFGPMVGDLWGTLILSRLPVKASGVATYEEGQRFTTGYSWAILEMPGCETLVINTHLASGVDLGEERAHQMEQLLQFWGGRPCTVIMGDTNAEPDSKAVSMMLQAGFTDWLGQWTFPRDRTWPANLPVESIDYIATTSEFQATFAHTVPTVASDHRPVIVDLKYADNKEAPTRR